MYSVWRSTLTMTEEYFIPIWHVLNNSDYIAMSDNYWKEMWKLGGRYLSRHLPWVTKINKEDAQYR
jgi:hypothetical protein